MRPGPLGKKTMTLNLLRNTAANTAIEYALIASAIALVIVGTLRLLGVELGDIFTNVATEMENANN